MVPKIHSLFIVWLINAKENRRDNQEEATQRNWQHRVHKTQGEDKQNISNDTSKANKNTSFCNSTDPNF
jgi:hypothetical protein